MDFYQFSGLVTDTACQPRASATLRRVVTTPSPEWSRRVHLDHDGIDYEITVTQRGGEFYGEWKCGACGRTGGSALASATADKAKERAQISLFAHHTLAHRSTALE